MNQEHTDKTHEWASWDKQFLWHPFTPMRRWLQEIPAVITRGEGIWLFDAQGRKYLDGVSSLWCNVHGHQHPYINQAVKDQLDRIAHSTLLGLSNIPSIQLARQLVALTPPSLQRVFYSDSGATAVEIAIKMAFQYCQLTEQRQRTKFVTLARAYHGDTIGAVSLGYSNLFHRYFDPLLFDALRINPPYLYRTLHQQSIEECEQQAIVEARKIIERHASEICAFVVEPLVQGAAGIWTHRASYLNALYQLSREIGALFIVDEVATGFGRTGKMFALEYTHIEPDILCLAKGLSGGYLPVAATLSTEKIFQAFLGEVHEGRTFFHGHTFTGNPLGCAASIASLEIFEKNKIIASLPEKIQCLEKELHTLIEPCAHVVDIRQRGLMVGIELAKDSKSWQAYDEHEQMGYRVCQRLRNYGVLLRPLGDTIVFMPPLCIKGLEMNRALELLRRSIIEETESQ